MHPVIVSEVRDAKLNQKEIKTLSSVPNDGSVHRVRISVSHTSAPEASKCVKLREKSGELKPATKAAPKNGQDLVICMQMLVKDASSLSSNLFTRVNLVDSGNFFGIQPKDALTNDKKLKEYVQRLERFNVWLEASV